MTTRDGAEADQARIYLVYADNGLHLVYAGSDERRWQQECDRLGRVTAGHVGGYQFVGRQRFDLRAYLDAPPTEHFLALRSRRDLFDFGWHPRSGQ